MSKKVVPMLVLIFMVLFVLLSGCASLDSKKNQPTEAGKIVQWEYKVIQVFDQVGGPFYNPDSNYESYSESGTYVEDSIDPDLEIKLTLLGQDGWELVGFTGEYPNVESIMIFKRIKQ